MATSDWYLGVEHRGVFLHRLFLDDPQDVQCGRIGAANMSRAVAAGARDIAAFAQRRTQALARQFKQAEARNLAHLNAGAIVAQELVQPVLHLALVAG